MPHTASTDKLQVLTNAVCLQRRREVAENCICRSSSGIEEMPLHDSKAHNHGCINSASCMWRKQIISEQSIMAVLILHLLR